MRAWDLSKILQSQNLRGGEGAEDVDGWVGGHVIEEQPYVEVLLRTSPSTGNGDGERSALFPWQFPFLRRIWLHPDLRIALVALSHLLSSVVFR